MNAYTNDSCHKYECIYESVMSRKWMRLGHVTRMNAHTNRSRHKYDYIYEWVMSHIWLHIRTSNVTHVITTKRKFKRSSEEAVVSRTNESRPNYKWVMANIRMSRVTHMNAYTNEWVMSHIYEWVMSHLWLHIQLSCVRHMNACMNALCIYEWVLSRIWLHVRISHVKNDEPCHIYDYIYEWVMSHMWIHVRMSHVTHIWMSHVTHMITYTNESRHRFDTRQAEAQALVRGRSHVTYKRVISPIRTSHVDHMNQTRHTYEYIYEWVMSHICMHTRMPHVTNMITFTNEPCHTCDTHRAQALALVGRSSHVTYTWVMYQLQMSHVAYKNESCHACDTWYLPSGSWGALQIQKPVFCQLW